MSVAWLTSVIDWDTCKLQYEVLGDSLERVAETHNLSPSSVRRVAEEENWQPIDPSNATLQDMTSYLVDVRRSLQVKLDLASLYREIELFPKITSIEDKLVEKIRSAVNSVDTTDPRSASALRALGQSLYAIAERKNKYAADDELSQEDTNYTVEIVSTADKAISRANNIKMVQAKQVQV